jgi:hypothetical protein
MYTAFIEVLGDLWVFVTAKRAHSVVSDTVLFLPEKKPEQVLPHETIQSVKANYSMESRVLYINASRVMCLQTPHIHFDTLRGILKYGDTAKVIQHKDQWCFVESPTVQGWVETKYLTDDKCAVLPQLQDNQVYSAHSTETKKLRQYLDDELIGGLLELSLQSSEYMMYRLKKIGIAVAWPLERPRLPGLWQSILSGKRGVSIGLAPKTGSVLESRDDNTHFLAFIESVTPEESISISCVGRLQAGVYEHKEFTKAQWQQWKPVFISFT